MKKINKILLTGTAAIITGVVATLLKSKKDEYDEINEWERHNLQTWIEHGHDFVPEVMLDDWKNDITDIFELFNWDEADEILITFENIKNDFLTLPFCECLRVWSEKSASIDPDIKEEIFTLVSKYVENGVELVHAIEMA